MTESPFPCKPTLYPRFAALVAGRTRALAVRSVFFATASPGSRQGRTEALWRGVRAALAASGNVVPETCQVQSELCAMRA
jgi:hypothetical protein